MNSMRGLFIAAIALVVACSSEEDDASRKEIRTEIDSLQQVSERLGFSLQETLVLREPQTVPLRWHEAPEAIAFSPSAGNTEATIQLSYRDAPIDEVQVVCDHPEDFSPEMCSDRLESALRMTIETEDGALDEAFEVVYRAYDPRTVEIVAKELDYRRFTGAFVMPPVEEIVLDGEPIDALYLGFFGHAEDGEYGGAFIAHTETQQDEYSGTGFLFNVASF